MSRRKVVPVKVKAPFAVETNGRRSNRQMKALLAAGYTVRELHMHTVILRRKRHFRFWWLYSYVGGENNRMLSAKELAL